MTYKLDAIHLWRLAVPLVKPYRLSFGPVTAYDTIIAELTDTDGRRGWGEATLLTGYTDETIDGAWRTACELAPQLLLMDREAFAAHCATAGAKSPFTATAFMSAYEMLADSEVLRPGPKHVPILGLLHATEPGAVREEFAALLEAGYKTIKVKVGFDVEADIENVRAIHSVVAGRTAIRLDANQGYSAGQAVQFLKALDPAGIELFEQPCAAGDWAAHAQVVKAARVPMMLDESIYGLADIDRAAREQQAAYVKVKLMKFVSLKALVEAILRIRSLGMRPVLGNGVANDLGCWMEACVASTLIDNAGEMNGFLKPSSGLFAEPLKFDRGQIELPAQYTPTLDPAALRRYQVAEWSSATN